MVWYIFDQNRERKKVRLFSVLFTAMWMWDQQLQIISIFKPLVKQYTRDNKAIVYLPIQSFFCSFYNYGGYLPGDSGLEDPGDCTGIGLDTVRGRAGIAAAAVAPTCAWGIANCCCFDFSLNILQIKTIKKSNC